MAQHHVTTRPATSTVDAYLDDLGARLRGPRRTPARVLAEVGDGLAEAIQANLAHGMPPDTANAKAVETFGAPDCRWPPSPLATSLLRVGVAVISIRRSNSLRRAARPAT